MIRKYETSDRDRLIELGNLLKEEFAIDRLSKNEEILVHEDANVDGFVVYSKLYEVLDVMYIVVDEKARRRGIASSLMKYLIDELKPEKIMLEVRISNEEAITFYEKLGFKKLRTIKNYYGGIEDALAMELEVL